MQQQSEPQSLDDVVKPERTLASGREYLNVVVLTEGGGIIGAQTGAHLSMGLAESALSSTGRILVGDYVGATIGQLVSYWYNNREKYHNEDGKLKKLKLLRDFAKVVVYDIPLTGMTYAVASPAAYYLLEHGVDKRAVALASSVMIITLWHTLNYFVYSAIKSAADEKLLSRIGSGVRSSIGYFTRGTPHQQ